MVLGSCWPDDGINRNLSRLQQPERFASAWDLSSLLPCLARTGGGCNALEQCAGYAITAVSDATEHSYCEGSVIVSKRPNARLTIDCALLGGSCDPALSCDLDENAVRCDETATVPACTADGRPVTATMDGRLRGRSVRISV